MIIRLVLRALLGKFVDLTSTQLNTDFWNGHVTIQNVALRSDLLALFGLPMTLSTATVRRLRLLLPWKSLDSGASVRGWVESRPPTRLNAVGVCSSPRAHTILCRRRLTPSATTTTSILTRRPSPTPDTRPRALC